MQSTHVLVVVALSIVEYFPFTLREDLLPFGVVVVISSAAPEHDLILVSAEVKQKRTDVSNDAEHTPLPRAHLGKHASGV